MVRKFLKKGETQYDVKKVIKLYHKHKHIGLVAEITKINRRTIKRYLDNNDVKRYPYRYKPTINKKVFGNGMRGKHISDYPKHKEVMQKRRGKNHPNYVGKIKCNCYWCGKEMLRLESNIKLIKHLNCGSKYCKFAQRHFYRGKNSPHWNGGPKTEIGILKKCDKYKGWRNSVFKRDDYTCQECGQLGGCLCAHHIKSFTFYPKVRFDLNNGQTLCLECHKLTDNYLHKAKLESEKR